MAQVAALARLRVRRKRRPPAQRRIFNWTWVALTLAMTTYNAVGLVAGELWRIGSLVVWIFLYFLWRRLASSADRWERAGLNLPPVSRFEWGLLGFQLCLIVTLPL